MKLPRSFRPDKNLDDKIDELIKGKIRNKSGVSDFVDRVKVLFEIYEEAKVHGAISDTRDVVNKLFQMFGYDLWDTHYTKDNHGYEFWIKPERITNAHKVVVRNYEISEKLTSNSHPTILSLPSHAFAIVNFGRLEVFCGEYMGYKAGASVSTIRKLSVLFTDMDTDSLEEAFSYEAP